MNDYSINRNNAAHIWVGTHQNEAKEITKEVDIFDFAKMMVTTNPRWDSIAEHAEKRALLLYRQNGGDNDDILIVHEIARICHLVGLVPKSDAAKAVEAKEKKTRGKRGASKPDAEKSVEEKK